MTLKKFFGMFIAICLLDALLGPFGMIVAYFLISKHTRNFVIQPLSKNISVNGNLPTNYLYRKMQSIRGVIWFFAIIFDIELVYILELFAIGIGCMNEEDKTTRRQENEYIKKQSYSYKDVISGKNVKVNLNKKEEMLKTQIRKVEIKKDEIEKNDSNIFDKPIEDIKTEFSNNLVNKKDDVNRFNFNKPVADISVSEPIQETTVDAKESTELKTDEISCEKCGTIMSKHKVACPKCGTLVKNTYRTGK